MSGPVVGGLPIANYIHDGADNNPRMFAVNRYGRPWFEIVDFDLGDIQTPWSEPETTSFTVSPLHTSGAYLPLKTRDFEIMVTYPDAHQPFWGEPVSMRGTPSGCEFQVNGLLSLFGDRFIDRASLIFDSVPQGQIMSAIVKYAQDEARTKYRNFRIVPRAFDLGTVLSKVRSREYFREEHANILDMLNEFRNTTTPISIQMTYVKNQTTGVWTRYLDIIPVYDIIHPLSVPLYYSTSDITNNITDFEYEEDATGLANDAYVTGGSNGDIQFEGHWIDQLSGRVHYDRQTVISQGDMTDPDWLKSYAHQQVDLRKRPVQNITLTSVTAPMSILAAAWVGTIWPVRIDHGRIQVKGNFRITSRTIHPKERTVTLTLTQMMNPIKPPSEALVLWPVS